MRHFLIVVVAVAFCSTPTWADSFPPPDTELDVNAWATIKAPVTGATETIDLNFLYDTPSPSYELGQVIPGSMSVVSSGFLGTFSAGMLELGYLPLYNNSAGSVHDEIDLDWGLSWNGGIPTGTSAYFYQWSCQTQACISADGASWSGDPVDEHPSGLWSEGSEVTVVAVPDGDSFLWLSLAALASFGLVWRWRRQPEQIAAR